MQTDKCIPLTLFRDGAPSWAQRMIQTHRDGSGADAPTAAPTPAPIKAVSFDFDNTLLQSEAGKFTALQEIAARYEGGLEALATVPRDARTVPPGAAVPTRYTIFRDLAARLHERGVRSEVAGETAERFGARMCDEFSALVLRRLPQAPEVPGAVAMLRHLSARGLPLYVNSATPQAPLVQLVEALGWSGHFRAVLGTTEHGGTKAEHLRTIAAAEGLSPAQVLHVGDGDNDRRAAVECGCPFVGVNADTPFAGPVATTVDDMFAACDVICELARVPPRPDA